MGARGSDSCIHELGLTPSGKRHGGCVFLNSKRSRPAVRGPVWYMARELQSKVDGIITPHARNLVNLKGGMNNWSQHGLPVKKGRDR